jgi:hypothetical protein
MGAVRKIMEFYYRKGRRGLQGWSLPGGVEGRIFVLGHFYIILNL